MSASLQIKTHEPHNNPVSSCIYSRIMHEDHIPTLSFTMPPTPQPMTNNLPSLKHFTAWQSCHNREWILRKQETWVVVYDPGYVSWVCLETASTAKVVFRSKASSVPQTKNISLEVRVLHCRLQSSYPQAAAGESCTNRQTSSSQDWAHRPTPHCTSSCKFPKQLQTQKHATGLCMQ